MSCRIVNGVLLDTKKSYILNEKELINYSYLVAELSWNYDVISTWK